MRRFSALLLVLISCLTGHAVRGQIDPDKRELIQLGFSQPLQGASPIDGYGYYYLNEPNFFATNVTLRLALAPVYVDTETGFIGLLGTNTDLGVGLAGGGFADDYYEFHNGQYLPGESFLGNDAEGSVSIYHLFDPGQRIPLYGIVRLKEHYSLYDADNTTSDYVLEPNHSKIETLSNFVLPANHSTVSVRTGLRLGGREPLLNPELAMELSVWYENQYRTDHGGYGLDDDRNLNEDSQLFWGRALLVYTFPESKQRFNVSLTGGGTVQADRFSAYRIGGDMPMISEFPLIIPGYFDGELSARDFACFTAEYSIPLGPPNRWSLDPIASAATVDYLPGTEQGSHFNSGAGLGLGYRSRTGKWQALATYGYGFEAIRSTGRGGQSVGVMLQINLGFHSRNGGSTLDSVAGFLQGMFLSPGNGPQ